MAIAYRRWVLASGGGGFGKKTPKGMGRKYLNAALVLIGISQHLGHLDGGVERNLPRAGVDSLATVVTSHRQGPTTNVFEVHCNRLRPDSK